jgi:hypothetical protein
VTIAFTYEPMISRSITHLFVGPSAAIRFKVIPDSQTRDQFQHSDVHSNLEPFVIASNALAQS